MGFYSEVPYEEFGYYDTPSVYDVGGSILTGIVMIYLFVLLIALIVGIVNYVFRGIGMYHMAKREGMAYPWLAFVPFARTYLQGELGGTVHLKKRQIKNPGIWLIVMPFISGIVGGIFYVIVWIVLGFGMFFSYDGFGFGTITGLIVVLTGVIVFFVLYEAVYKVLRILVNRQIYEKFTTPGMAIVHAVLGVLLPLYESICLFVMRNHPYNPGKEPDLGTPFMTPPPAAPVPPVPPQASAEIPVDGEFRKVDETVVPGEYRKIEEPPKPEQEQMVSSYAYGNVDEKQEETEESKTEE